MINGNNIDNYNVVMLPDGGAEVTPTAPSIVSLPKEVNNMVEFIRAHKEEAFPSYLSPTQRKNGVDCLKEMATVAIEDYKIDLESRKEWEDNVAEQLKLMTSFMEEKTDPWVNCSNINLPFLAIAVIQFQSRVFEAIIPPREVVKAFPTGDEDIKRAERVSKYMNYQLLYEMEDFEEGMDKSLFQLPVVGSMFRKTYYDPVKKQVVSKYRSSIDVVVNYGVDIYDNAERTTDTIYMYPSDIKKRVILGVFSEDADGLGPGSVFRQPSKIRETADNASGVKDVTQWRSNPRTLLEQHRGWDLDGDGVNEPYIITVDFETEKVIRVIKRSYEDSLGNAKVTDYFTYYGFIPNPEGFYHLGFGSLLRGLNESANTIVNEVIDAGSLANRQGGFVSKRSGIKKGTIKFRMGEFQEVDAYVDDINKAIYNFNFKGPNDTLYAVLGLLYEYGKLVTSVSETMTGQLPSSDTPATTVMALIEEGRKVFSAIHKRIHRSFKKELRKIYHLNSIYLPENIYFKVLGDNNIPSGPSEQVGRADFLDIYDVIPVSDPNITSRAEKVLKAKELLTDVRANPLTVNDQKANYIATKRYYEALDIPGIAEVLKEPGPPLDIPQEEEIAQMMMERPVEVLPQQDHLQHLRILENFINGVFFSDISPRTNDLVAGHEKAHKAQLYLQTTKGSQGVGAR